MNRSEKNILNGRFQQMRASAKQAGKKVPSLRKLKAMFKEIVDMKCPSCKQTMRLQRRAGLSDVITLQHDRSGQLRLICFGCNVRHHHFPGDTFYASDASPSRPSTLIRIHPATRPKIDAILDLHDVWSVQFLIDLAIEAVAQREGIDVEKINGDYAKAQARAEAITAQAA